MPYKDSNKQKDYLRKWRDAHPWYNKEWLKEHHNYSKEKHHLWYKKNKYKYKNRWIQKLGTNQDEQILRFIQAKRERRSIPKYKPLSIKSFKVNNQAQQSFPEEVRKQDDKFNNNYEGEKKGFRWVEGFGYITENIDVFID